MTPEPRVLISGAGIAGCAAAIALATVGVKVRCVERQPEWRFQSSGIFVYSNGLCAFDDLGLLDEIVAAGFVVPEGRNQLVDHTGASIVNTYYPAARAGQIPAIMGIKRAEMHRVLATRMESLGITVELDTTVTEIETDPNGADVTLSNGDSECFDLVIDAEGLRSTMRELLGWSVEPRYTGFGIWRSVHERPVDLTDKIMMFGPGKRFGIMPIADDRLYTFGTIREPKDLRYDPAEWPTTMAGKFAEFGGPARQFLESLGPGSEVIYTAVEEVALPLPWHRGRALIIGDAAHASTPFMGQGGTMALRDAVVLGRLVGSGRDLDKVIATFERLRMPTCGFVQDESRAVGVAGAREEPGESMDARNAAIRATAQDNIDRFYQRLDEFETATDAELDATEHS